MNRETLHMGFIGAGNMAFAIASALIKNDLLVRGQVYASAPTMRNLPKMESMGANITHSNSDLLKTCNVLMLGVKPHQVASVLRELQGHWKDGQILISIVGGVSIKSLYGKIPPTVRIVRILPNLPVFVQCGVLAFSLPSEVDREDPNVKKIIHYLFNDLGFCQEFQEDSLDAICGLCGSGPAFVFIAIQGLVDGAVKMGLPRNIATELATQTVFGAAKLVLESGKHPALLRDEECTDDCDSATLNGCCVLEESGVRAAFMSAVEEATKRSRELGQNEMI